MHCPILPDAHSHLDTRTPSFVAVRASVAGWLHTVTVAQTHRPLCDSVDTACERVRDCDYVTESVTASLAERHTVTDTDNLHRCDIVCGCCVAQCEYDCHLYVCVYTHSGTVTENLHRGDYGAVCDCVCHGVIV